MEEKKFSHIDVYKLIFESSTEGILVCNNKGEIKMVNESITRIFGYEKEELIDQKVEVLLPREYKESHVGNRDNYIKRPERKQMGAGRDLYGLKKNGDKFPIEISLNHMTIEDEFFVMALLTDITTRKNQEIAIHDLNAELEVKVLERTRKLNENQILFSLIAKNFPNGIICVLNRELEFTFAEGEELTKSGVKSKFLLNKSYLESFSSDNKEEVKSKINRAFAGEVVSFEVNKRKSVYQAHVVPLVYEKDRDVSHVLIVENNVTKVKNIEEKMKQSLQKEKELSEMKSQFVSMASHEFRTPLSTILSSISLIEKYDELGNEEKKKSHFEKVKKNIRNLTNMLNDTLTISRIEENMIEVNYEESSIRELMSEVIAESEGLKGENREVIVNFAGEEFLKIDKKIMKVVLSNLLSNALKYSEKDVVIDMVVEANECTVSIVDRGIGIPLAAQEKLFDRFYRADNAANIQGTGLGLNIVKSYITLLGGELSFNSVEDMGTTVFIKIPIN
ncbi:MAG: PAS domain-containing sensor histidine kinase [Flavobacteriales bacterium]